MMREYNLKPNTRPVNAVLIDINDPYEDSIITFLISNHR